MAQTKKSLGEPGQGRRMITNDFQKWQNRIPPRWERKGKSGRRQKWGCQEGHTSAHPKEDGQPGTFKRIRAEIRKEWEKTEMGLTKTMGTGRVLFAKEQNRGTNGSPGRPKNSIIKGGDGLWRKGNEKKRETPERRNSLEKTIKKSVEKRKY